MDDFGGGGGSGEDVLFTIGLEESKQTQGVLAGLQKAVLETENRIASSMSRLGDKVLQQTDRIASARDSASSGGVSQKAGGGVQVPIKPAIDPSSIKSSLGELGQGAEDAGRAAAERFTKGLEDVFKEAEGIPGLEERFASAEQAESVAKNMAKLLDDALSKEIKGLEGGFQIKPEVLKPDDLGLLEELESIIGKVSELDKESSSLTSRQSQSFRNLTEDAENVGTALGQVAGGVAFLTAGNEDLKKFVDTLLAVRGTIEVVTGVNKAILSGARFLSELTTKKRDEGRASEIATEKQRLLTDAAKIYDEVVRRETADLDKSNRELKEHETAMRGAAAAARDAAQAEGQFAASSRAAGAAAPGRVGRGRSGLGGAVAGSLAGVGGSAVSQALGGGVAGQVGAVATQLKAEQVLDRLFGRGSAATGLVSKGVLGRLFGGAAGAATTFVAGGGAAAGGGLLAGAAAATGPIAAVVGAIAGVGLAAVTLTETLTGADKAADSWSQTIARNNFGLTGLITSWIDGAEQAKAASLGVADASLKQARVQSDLTNSLESLQIAARNSAADLKIKNVEKAAALVSSSGAGGGGEATASANRAVEAQKVAARDVLQLQLQGAKLSSSGSDSQIRANGKLLEGARRRLELATAEAAEFQGLKKVFSEREASDATSLAVLREMAQQSKIIQSFEQEKSKNTEAYLGALQRQMGLSEKLQQLEEGKLRLVQQEAKERDSANERAIQAGQKRLELVTQEGQKAREQLQTAAERFSQLTKEEQVLAIRAKKKADSRGVESLSDEERNRLRGLGSDADALAKRGDIAEARRGGFFQTFGASEQAKIAQSQQQAQQVALDIQARQSVTVQIKQDEERLSAVIVDAVKKELVAQESRLARLTEKKLEQDRTAASVAASEEAKRIAFEAKSNS